MLTIPFVPLFAAASHILSSSLSRCFVFVRIVVTRASIEKKSSVLGSAQVLIKAPIQQSHSPTISANISRSDLFNIQQFTGFCNKFAGLYGAKVEGGVEEEDELNT